MEDKNRDRLHELKAHMRDLEEQQNEQENLKRELRQKEEDEDMGLTSSNRRMEEMGLACLSDDKDILQLIEQKQQIMCDIRNKKAEFATEFDYECKKKREQIELEIEDTQAQLISIQRQQEEDDKNNPDTEEDGENVNDRE